jgi:phage gp29-like protein
VLAHFMNLGQAAGTGSYALGESFMDFFVASLQTTAQEVADTATQHIVEDLVDINVGPDEPAPRITFQEIGSRSAVTAQAIALLVNSGVLLREPALERFMREAYGIPEKEPIPGPPPANNNPGGN